jgi:hypothetical protein
MYMSTVYICCIRIIACNWMSCATCLMQVHKFVVACVACNWISVTKPKIFNSEVPYQQVVGSLMYAMLCIRLDLAYPISVMSQHMANPSQKHWIAMKRIFWYLQGTLHVATPFWVKCEDETHTPKSGNLESSETPENSELDCRSQNTLHWGVLYTIGKVLKCKCPKWPQMSHLDIFSPSYGQKKTHESNCQFDSRPLKVGNRPESNVCRRSAHGVGKLSKRTTRLFQTSSLSKVWARSYECPKSWESKLGQFRDSSLRVMRKSVIRM